MQRQDRVNGTVGEFHTGVRRHRLHSRQHDSSEMCSSHTQLRHHLAPVTLCFLTCVWWTGSPLFHWSQRCGWSLLGFLRASPQSATHKQTHTSGRRLRGPHVYIQTSDISSSQSSLSVSTHLFSCRWSSVTGKLAPESATDYMLRFVPLWLCNKMFCTVADVTKQKCARPLGGGSAREKLRDRISPSSLTCQE